MEANLQRRIQRYGWDLAVDDYEPGWAAQLAIAQNAMLDQARLARGERVIDVACGTGLVTFAASKAVAPGGAVLGVDISGRMVEAASRRAQGWDAWRPTFARMDAEALEVEDASFDVALCALGLMYAPEPERALAEMRRVLRPGGRAAVAVWGQRSRCGWSPVFEIVDAEVRSEVCPLFFRLGGEGALSRLFSDAGFGDVEQRRIPTTLFYASGEEACDAAFVGGPVALAWSRFDADTRARARARYLEAIAPWRSADGYEIPGEFVAVAGRVPSA